MSFTTGEREIQADEWETPFCEQFHAQITEKTPKIFFFLNPSKPVASLPSSPKNTLTVNMFESFCIQIQFEKFSNPLPWATSHLLQQYFPQSYKSVWGQQKKRIPPLRLSTGSLIHTKPVKHNLKYKAGTLATSSFHSGFRMSLTLLSRCVKWTVHYFCTLMQPGASK